MSESRQGDWQLLRKVGFAVSEAWFAVAFWSAFRRRDGLPGLGFMIGYTLVFLGLVGGLFAAFLLAGFGGLMCGMILVTTFLVLAMFLS